MYQCEIILQRCCFNVYALSENYKHEYFQSTNPVFSRNSVNNLPCSCTNLKPKNILHACICM